MPRGCLELAQSRRQRKFREYVTRFDVTCARERVILPYRISTKNLPIVVLLAKPTETGCAALNSIDKQPLSRFHRGLTLERCIDRRRRFQDGVESLLSHANALQSCGALLRVQWFQTERIGKKSGRRRTKSNQRTLRVVS